MIRFSAAPWPTMSATASNVTSERTNGEGANALTLDGLTLGKFWIGTDGTTSISMDVTLGTSQAFDFALAIGHRRNMASAVPNPIVRVYRGPQAGPRVKLAELSNCPPLNLGFSTLSDNTTASAVWSFEVAAPSTLDPTDYLTVPFLALGTWDGSLNSGNVPGRPRRLRRSNTKQIGNIYGARFVRPQPMAYGLAIHFVGQVDDDNIEDLIASICTAELAYPLLYCHDSTDAFGSDLTTVCGGLSTLPEAGTDNGDPLVDFEIELTEIIS